MKILAAVAIVLVCSALVEASNKVYDLEKHPRALWNEWKRDNTERVQFASAQEESKRFGIFAHNILRIQQLNERHAGQTKFMLNKFAHLSEKEFSAMMLNKKLPEDFVFDPSVDSMLPEVPEAALAALPASMDWRTRNPPVVTPVKDQGACGSCWSFSSTGNMEGQWALAGNPLVSLSEQNLMDCDHTCYKNVCDDGCDGGKMANAFIYVIKNGGIDTDSSYPYEGYAGKCRYSASNVGAKIVNWTFIPKTAAQMAYYIVNQGPISIAADASMWQFYYDGVWYFPCGTSLDHGILIVGYGVETDILGEKMPYWIVKNSWGADWGLDGYILIERGDDRCGLQQYPITSLVTNPPPAPPVVD